MSPNNTFEFIPGEIEEKPASCNESSADFDKAISLTGYGPFHYKLVAVCALCLLTNGIHNGLSSYVFSAAQCDLQLTSAQLGFLNVSFLIGGITSAFLWGAAADLFGRRKVLLVTLCLGSFVTLISSVMQTFTGLATCRYFNGFLVGAAGTITFNYIAEFHAPKQRSKSVCYSGLFFTAAWLILPIMSYLILPIPKMNLGNNIHLSSWRLFLIIVAIPEFLTAIWLYFMPESPKFLAENGNMTSALKILQDMFASNHRCDPTEFPIKILVMKEMNKIEEEVPCTGKIKRMLGKMMVQMKKLFIVPLVFITFLVCSIMFCNMFGYFGLGLWLPELFNRFEQYHEQFPNKTVTVQHLASFKVTVNNTCSSEFNTKLFQTTVLIGVSSLIGNILSGYLSGKVSIKLVPIITMVIGGVSSGSIYWLKSSLQNLIVACIFQASMATANVAIGSVAVELFPTRVAAMALCLTILVGRLGAMVSNIVFGLLMDNRCEIPIFLVSAILLFGTILCFFIPTDTSKKIDFYEYAKQRLHISVISDEKKQVEC